MNILRTGRAAIAADAAFDGDSYRDGFGLRSESHRPRPRAISLVPRPLLEYDTRRPGAYAAFLETPGVLDSGWSKNIAAQLDMAAPHRSSVRRPRLTQRSPLRLERLKG